jgi:hypothetical protein
MRMKSKSDDVMMALLKHVISHTDVTSERLEKLQIHIHNELKSINGTLIHNTAILDEHQKRTTALENVVKPISTHVAVVAALSKVMAGIGVAAGAIISIMKIVEFLNP